MGYQQNRKTYIAVMIFRYINRNKDSETWNIPVIAEGHVDPP